MFERKKLINWTSKDNLENKTLRKCLDPQTHSLHLGGKIQLPKGWEYKICQENIHP